MSFKFDRDYHIHSLSSILAKTIDFILENKR